MTEPASGVSVREQLRKTLSGLTAEQAEKLAELAREVSFAKDEIVFRERDWATRLFLVLEGCVFLRAKFSRGSATVNFASIGPSEFLGWSAVVPPHRLTAEAMAVMPTKVLAFDGNELLKLCDQDPSLGYVLMRHLLTTVGKRLTATRRQMFDMFEPKALEQRPDA